MSTSQSKFKFDLGSGFIWWLKFCTLIAIGCIMLLNFQPWRDVASLVGAEIISGKSVPFQRAIESIPFIGGWVQWFCEFLVLCGAVDIIALGLWGLINGLESLPWFFDTKFGNKIPEKTKVILSNVRWGAYAIEIVVCWVRYPCYVGGFKAVMDDFPNFDPNLIDWMGMVNFLIALLAFEGLLILYRKITELGLFSKSVASNRGNP